MGAEVNVGVLASLEERSRPEERRTLLDWVQFALPLLRAQIAAYDAKVAVPEIPTPGSETLSGWQGYFQGLRRETQLALAKTRMESKRGSDWEKVSRDNKAEAVEYYTDMEAFLLERGAKSWDVVYPLNVSTAKLNNVAPATSGKNNAQYYLLPNMVPVSALQNPAYDTLFEACFAGDNERIQELCLPAQKPDKDAVLLQIAVSIAHESSTLR